MPTVGLHGVDLGVQASLHAIGLGAQEKSLGVTYDAASEAIFAAFTTPPNDTRKGQIDALVVALKSAGVWTKLDALYVLAAADSQASLINWKAPGTYNATAINAPTFTADRGFTGASTKYLDTGFNPSTATTPNFVRNSATLFAWSRSDLNVASGLWGMASSGSGESILYPRQTNLTAVYINQASASTWANSNGSEFFSITRRAASGAGAIEAYRNTTSLGTGTTASVAPLSANFCFFRRAATYWTGECASGGIGSQLSAAENTSLYNALNAYMAAVGAA